MKETVEEIKVEDNDDDDDADDGWEAADSERRTRWLMSAGKEGRIAFWELTSF